MAVFGRHARGQGKWGYGDACGQLHQGKRQQGNGAGFRRLIRSKPGSFLSGIWFRGMCIFTNPEKPFASFIKTGHKHVSLSAKSLITKKENQ